MSYTSAKATRLYELVVQRHPTKDELEAAAHFVEAQRVDFAKRAPANTWTYGYGGFDEKTQRLLEFVRLPYFNGSGWQGGPDRPDPALGYLLWNEKGGHPGDNPKLQAALRWTAPVDATKRVCICGLSLFLTADYTDENAFECDD